jgi:hypothetical protein
MTVMPLTAYHQSDLGDFAIGSCGDDIEYPNNFPAYMPLPVLPQDDEARNDFRIDGFAKCAGVVKAAWPNCQIFFYLRGVRIARRVQDRGINNVGLQGIIKLGHQTDQLKKDLDSVLGYSSTRIRAWPRPADPVQPVPHPKCRDHRFENADLDLVVCHGIISIIHISQTSSPSPDTFSPTSFFYH